jgi:LysR family transcriptional regulator, flagellar master operon regulator
MLLIGKSDQDVPMQIDLLETFLDLAQTRSFNRTADRMGLTQSSVSGRVTALESAVGSRLFTRSRAGTDLTAEGVKFEPLARALRHAWVEGIRHVQGATKPTLRIGIQNDLAASSIGTLVAAFRTGLPQSAFYIEPDYSNQMCADVTSGTLDFAIMFTPHPHPDLHFTSAGDVTYRMVSADTDTVAGLTPDRYIFTHFSAAFTTAHRQALPAMATAPLSVGQSATVEALLTSTGGTAYVLADAAMRLVGTGRFQHVTDAPLMPQPVYTAVHLRNRTSATHRTLTRIAVGAFAGRVTPPPAADTPAHGPAAQS